MLKRSRVVLLFVIFSLLFFIFPPYFPSASAQDTVFQVDIKEVLSISITKVNNYIPTGNVGNLLTDSIIVRIGSNHNHGFTAGMTTNNTSTSLSHSTMPNTTIPTLSSNVSCQSSSCPQFPDNRWGYSLDSSDSNRTYKPLVNRSSAPITILSSSNAIESYQTSVYFGAKSDITQASGLYSSIVMISVVSGTNGADLLTEPTNPDVPATDDYTGENVSYNSSNDTTVYTRNYVGNNQMFHSENSIISEGDNTNLYSGYNQPQGVTRSSDSNIQDGSLVSTILVTTASVAATSGIFFFILAKRRKDDDEEEDEEKIE